MALLDVRAWQNKSADSYVCVNRCLSICCKRRCFGLQNMVVCNVKRDLLQGRLPSFAMQA